VWEVPTGGGLPTPDGRVQMYPCYAFEAHIVYVEIDPETAQPALRRYACGHDCGVMINPDIVHGMTYGGIAHGIGAALYEKFAYTPDGQLASGTFMDYLIPSALEVPPISIVDHCTPSPLTTSARRARGGRLSGRAGGHSQRGERRARSARGRSGHAAHDAEHLMAKAQESAFTPQRRATSHHARRS